MSGHTESTGNSVKFVPMPMSALLANLKPLQKSVDSPDSSFTSEDESDDSTGQTIAKKPLSPKINHEFRTPNTRATQVKDDIKGYNSERKITSKNDNKENMINEFVSNQTHPNNKDMFLSTYKKVNSVVTPDLGYKNRGVLMPPSSLAQIIPSKTGSTIKRTPDLVKFSSGNQSKTKVTTPKIKTGIRKFTPGSARKSQKKTPLKTLAQNRDRVRCELFTQNPDGSTPHEVPPKQPTTNYSAAPPRPEPAPGSVMDTPLNKRPPPISYAATPSYPQGTMGNNSKILFKTTSIKDKKYLFLKKLGVGGSSEVYKVLEVGTSSEYAVKCVYLATDQELAQGYINEVRLLRDLQNSDRVIRLYDYEYDRANKFLRLVLEVGETDLSSFLKARGTGLPPALVLHYWEEMLHAVNYIHEHGVIHADLKPANFLLVCGRLKLIDFGIASAISSDATSVVRSQATGTYSYISPEALMGGAGGYGASSHHGNAPIKISFRSDVWSLGCILYSMVYGRTPFGHISNLAKLAAILDPAHKIDYPPVEHLPASLIAVLKWCLTYNARARPSVRELLSVPYMQPTLPVGPAKPTTDQQTAHEGKRSPIPQQLLDKLKPLVSPQEYRLLLLAEVPS